MFRIIYIGLGVSLFTFSIVFVRQQIVIVKVISVENGSLMSVDCGEFTYRVIF